MNFYFGYWNVSCVLYIYRQDIVCPGSWRLDGIHVFYIGSGPAGDRCGVAEVQLGQQYPGDDGRDEANDYGEQRREAFPSPLDAHRPRHAWIFAQTHDIRFSRGSRPDPRQQDLFHEDGMGGLSGLSRLLTEVVVLSVIAAGLWIGSIPYAFKYNFLLLILCLGLVIQLSILGYAFYQLHIMLNIVRNAKLQECFSIFRKAYAIYNRPLEERVNFLIDLFLAEFALMQAYRLRLWPVDRKTMLESFSTSMSFLPLVLQYLLQWFS